MRVILPSRRYLQICRDSFGYNNGVKNSTGIYGTEARDVDKHSKMHKTVPHNKEQFSPKCQ